jgi:hypothetical protein
MHGQRRQQILHHLHNFRATIKDTMNKSKAKSILHWVGFVACIGAAAYVAFVAKGLSVGERVPLALSTLGGLFVALKSVFPALNKAIDELPTDDGPPEGNAL